MGAKELGERLKLERESMPYSPTQADIGEEIGGKHLTTICHWEKGRRLEAHMTFIKLCALYNLSVDDLMEAMNA